MEMPWEELRVCGVDPRQKSSGGRSIDTGVVQRQHLSECPPWAGGEVPEPPGWGVVMALPLQRPPDQVRSMRVKLLGGFYLWRDAEPVQTPGTAQRLIAFVALNSPAPRDFVAGRLWPDVHEGRAKGSLRTCIWQLQRSCPEILRSEGENLLLSGKTQVDAIDFNNRALQILQDPSSAVLSDLNRELTGDELLPGWYDEWVLAERERSRQLRLHALEAAAGEFMAQGRAGAAMHVALTAALVEPLRESCHRLIISIHLAEGNGAEAMRHYLAWRGLLGKEMGIAPSNQITNLVDGILSSDTGHREPIKDTSSRSIRL
jgi:DNA-binding SARP family transcriptional activator